jgi:hypothetical protein
MHLPSEPNPPLRPLTTSASRPTAVETMHRPRSTRHASFDDEKDRSTGIYTCTHPNRLPHNRLAHIHTTARHSGRAIPECARAGKGYVKGYVNGRGALIAWKPWRSYGTVKMRNSDRSNAGTVQRPCAKISALGWPLCRCDSMLVMPRQAEGLLVCPTTSFPSPSSLGSGPTTTHYHARSASLAGCPLLPARHLLPWAQSVPCWCHDARRPTPNLANCGYYGYYCCCCYYYYTRTHARMKIGTLGGYGYKFYGRF